MSAKDASLNLRIRSSLKKELETVAASEGRSVAQICELLLYEGVEGYHKEGTKFIQRLIAKQKLRMK
jgi:hypothetical protein